MSITKITIDGTDYELKPIPENKTKEVEKDYVILKFRHAETKAVFGVKTKHKEYYLGNNKTFEIYEVKRWSDNEIFTLGDICKKKDGTVEAPIKSFTIPNKESTQIWVICDEGKISLSNPSFGDWLSNIEKVKVNNNVLFTKEQEDYLIKLIKHEINASIL